jgi:hypothetical protein
MDIAAQNNLVAPLYIQRTESLVKLDGLLDEEAWHHAVVLKDFMQGGPVPGNEVSNRTEVRILYNDQNLYIGITAFDSTGTYLVNSLQRDKYYRSEDGVSIMLDTYNDKSHALLLYSNTTGARFDEEVNSNGQEFNSAYNTFWDVRTHLFDGGYSMEFLIPFSSLRFQTKEEVTMGFKVIRQIGKRNEFDIYPACEKNLSNVVWRVNSEAEIIFKNLKAQRPVYVSPYLKLNYSEVSSLNDDGTHYETSAEFLTRNHFTDDETADRIISNAGIDAKIGLTKNFTLDATLNTDFAQVEADNRVFNFTRFNIFLPEKRQFFLEANDYMNFSVPGGFELFHSRNIGIGNGAIIPITGGLRLTGKAKGWQLGALDIQTHGREASDVKPENFSVVHLHKDLFHNGSFTSCFFANRMTTTGDSISNKVLAFDLLHKINDKWTYGLNIGGSKDKTEIKNADDNLIFNACAFRSVSYGYSNFLTITKAGKNFIPMSGFYIDNGFTTAYAYNGYTFRIKNNERLNYFDLSTEVSYKWNTRNTNSVESVYYNMTPALVFKNGMVLKNKLSLYSEDYLPYNWKFSDGLTIPKGKYSLWGNELTFESQKNMRLLYQAIITTDHFYGGSRIAAEPQLTGAINRHLSLQLDYLYTRINFPRSFSDSGQNKFESHLVAARLTYCFTAQTSFNLLGQYDNVSRTIGVNLRFRFNPKEGTDLYIVYNPSMNTELTRYTPDLPTVAQQVLIVKFTKTFSLART